MKKVLLSITENLNWHTLRHTWQLKEYLKPVFVDYKIDDKFADRMASLLHKVAEKTPVNFNDIVRNAMKMQNTTFFIRFLKMCLRRIV